jgi:hypothetical protein
VGSVAVVGQAIITVSGLASQGQVGSASVSIPARISLLGVSSTGSVGTVLVWGLVPDGQAANWQPIPRPINSWSPVADAQSATWINVG